MAGNFHEDFHGDEIPLPSERSTGLVFTAVALIAAYFLRGWPPALWMALATALALLTVSLLAPDLLAGANRAWMRFAMLLNKVVSPVVMGVLFVLTIIPFGLVMQLRRDPLRSKRHDGPTYWIDRTETPKPGSMTQQF
jgi:hypothetical protein